MREMDQNLRHQLEQTVPSRHKLSKGAVDRAREALNAGVSPATVERTILSAATLAEIDGRSRRGKIGPFGASRSAFDHLARATDEKRGEQILERALGKKIDTPFNDKSEF